MLFNIGDAEMTVGELTLRGCYLGSNVSYNVKKMVENGYLTQERSLHDRRSIRVRLTERGVKLRDRRERHASAPSGDASAGHAQHGRPAELSAPPCAGSSASGSAPSDLVQRPPQFAA